MEKISAERTDKQIPLLLRTLENAMRGGYSLVQALETAAGDVPPPLGDEVKMLVDDLKNGKPMQDSLNAWLKRTPSADLGLVIATFRVQFDVGGNLADKLNLLGQILEKRSIL